jgi:hypothetical protein
LPGLASNHDSPDLCLLSFLFVCFFPLLKSYAESFCPTKRSWEQVALRNLHFTTFDKGKENETRLHKLTVLFFLIGVLGDGTQGPVLYH